jgi:hypothetical protein
MSEDNKKEITKMPTQELVESIKLWVNIDDKIKKFNDEIKTLKNEKKEHECIILQELDKMDENTIGITDGKLKKNVLKSQTALKKDIIHKSIFEFIKDEKKTLDILDHMNKARPTVEKVNLKRIKNRDSKDDKIKQIFEKTI